MVSVVMSVLNGERFLREAVESILDQGFREFEFIIVDDGSTDRSASILDCYQSRDARVKVYHQGHAGLIQSLNRGCRLAQGKYIARMDADDAASKDRLMWQVDFMEAHPQIGVLGGAVEWIDATGKSLGTYRYPVEDRQIKALLLHGCALWHPTVLLRREVFVRTGGYRAVVVDAEDYDLWLRIADHFQLANLEAVVLKYRIHPYQISMRRREQQTRSFLAAQVAATTRKNGLPDPLGTVQEITPEALVALGVTLAQQRSRFVSDYWQWIRNMCTAGEYPTALKAALEILRSGFEDIERRQLADLHLTVARLLWREGRLLSSLLSAGRAVVNRPVVVGRPLKLLLRRLRGA
ncbi:MAG: glycosyltransferase [Bryobacteraceae bacterium]|jgi:glycosyltransferase involved in cell wall biosynthesis